MQADEKPESIEANDKLSAEDMQRVERYLSSPNHQIERKPFRPWLMVFLLIAVVLGLGQLSILISWLVLA